MQERLNSGDKLFITQKKYWTNTLRFETLANGNPLPKGNFLKGANFVIENIGKNPNDFTGKNLIFEFEVTNANGNYAYIDVRVEDPTTGTIKKIEFISGTRSITASNTDDNKDIVLRELLRRDVANSSEADFSDIEWRVEGFGSREQLKKKIKERLRYAIGNDKILPGDNIFNKFQEFTDEYAPGASVNNKDDFLLNFFEPNLFNNNTDLFKTFFDTIFKDY